MLFLYWLFELQRLEFLSSFRAFSRTSVYHCVRTHAALQINLYGQVLTLRTLAIRLPNVLFIIHYLRMCSSKNDSENWSGQNRTSRTACYGHGLYTPALVQHYYKNTCHALVQTPHSGWGWGVGSLSKSLRATLMCCGICPSAGISNICRVAILHSGRTPCHVNNVNIHQ